MPSDCAWAAAVDGRLAHDTYLIHHGRPSRYSGGQIWWDHIYISYIAHNPILSYHICCFTLTSFTSSCAPSPTSDFSAAFIMMFSWLQRGRYERVPKRGSNLAGCEGANIKIWGSDGAGRGFFDAPSRPRERVLCIESHGRRPFGCWRYNKVGGFTSCAKSDLPHGIVAHAEERFVSPIISGGKELVRRSTYARNGERSADSTIKESILDSRWIPTFS